MGFAPRKLLDFIPSIRKRRQDLEDIRTGRLVIVEPVPEARRPSPLLLTPQQRVKRATGALIVSSFFWFISGNEWRLSLLIYALFCGWLLTLWFMERYGERITAERRVLNRFFSGTYLAPRFALVVLGLLLFLLASFIVASPERLRHKITPMFVTLTGLVFVGPWWRIWRGLRFVFWSLIGSYFVVFVVFAAGFIALETLHWLFGETFGPPLRWLNYWGGD